MIKPDMRTLSNSAALESYEHLIAHHLLSADNSYLGFALSQKASKPANRRSRDPSKYLQERRFPKAKKDVIPFDHPDVDPLI